MSCGLFCGKQRTAYDGRISDWSSDVCSSDLHVLVQLAVAEGDQQHRDEADQDDRGHLEPDFADGGAESSGQRVGGRDARDADDDRTDETHGPRGQALLRQSAGALVGSIGQRGSIGSGHERSPSSVRVRGTTMSGTGSSRSILAAVEPRNSRRGCARRLDPTTRSEEHTSELQSLMRISYAVFCLKKKKKP